MRGAYGYGHLRRHGAAHLRLAGRAPAWFGGVRLDAEPRAVYFRGHTLLDLLSTHRSQITYRHNDTDYVIHRDASFQLVYKDEWT